MDLSGWHGDGGGAELVDVEVPEPVGRTERWHRARLRCGLGFKFWGSEFRVQGLGFWVWGSGFGVLGFGFWVLGFGFWV